MTVSRWWLWPLIVAAVVDLALVVRHQTSPAAAVNRAVTRTTALNGCQESVLLRQAGVDLLYVVGTWTTGGRLVVEPAALSFHPGAGLTSASRKQIELGAELGNATMSLAISAHQALTLGASYRSQLRLGASWLSGPCVPLTNPFQSRLTVTGQAGALPNRYTLYRGLLTVNRGGQALFSKADLWVGVRADGRLGFEVLRQNRGTSPSGLLAVATVFSYPRQHLNSLVRATVAARESFYTADYHRVLTALALTPVGQTPV